MKNQLICIALAILTMTSCENNSNDEVNANNLHTPKSAKVIKSSNDFGIALFKKINKAKETKGKNLMISPVSVAATLAMTYNGAEGDTKTAMEETLKLTGLTVEEINTTYQTLLDALQTVDEKVLLSIANSIWYNDKIDVKQDFIDINKQYYEAQVNALNFNNPTAKNIINGWIEDKTNDKIKNMINTINPTNIMFLVNAIYFKGTWQYEFDKENTINRTFTLTDGTTKQVETMVQKQNFNHLKNDLFEAVELPYGSEDYSMFVILPNIDKTPTDIVNELNSENWNNWLNKFETKNDLQLYLPKFKFEYYKRINNQLKDMGMDIAFKGGADFSKIINSPINIDFVDHKTFIEINEEGTEAAAANVIAFILGSNNSVTPNIYPLFINRPFMFVIQEKATNSMVFIGKVVDPELEK